MRKLFALVMLLTLLVLTFGCGGEEATNGNRSNTNTAPRNANASAPVVTNTTPIQPSNANTAAPITGNSNAGNANRAAGNTNRR